MNAPRGATAFAAVLLALAAPIGAQETRAVKVGTIDGLVTDSTLRPIEGADVAIVRTSVHVGTLASGRFRILSVPAGQYIVIVRKLGYHPISGVIEVPANDTLRLSYMMERLAQALDTAKIVESKQSWGMMEFEYRRKIGEGQFVTQDQIDKRNPVYLADMMRTFRGFQVKTGVFGHSIVSTRGSGSVYGSCSPKIYLDGVALPGQIDLDNLPSPKDIAGIEAYTGAAVIPLQYGGLGSACGVVLIWTRLGG